MTGRGFGSTLWRFGVSRGLVENRFVVDLVARMTNGSACGGIVLVVIRMRAIGVATVFELRGSCRQETGRWSAVGG